MRWSPGCFDNLAVVELLLQAKADVNALSDNGVTAIHAAVRGGHTATIELLLREKADVNTFLTGSGMTPLEEAVEGGNLEIVDLLLHAKANFKIGNVLQKAIVYGHTDVAELLRAAGAKE